ncbi:MAG: EAL and HDOD domain-containing protein [Pseudohaliea sp.]
MEQTDQGRPQAGDTGAGHAPVARQPIYDRNRDIFAYELLVHAAGADPSAETAAADGVASARAAIAALTRLDLEQVTDSRPAFINVSRDFLLDHHDLLSRATGTGIEVPCAACNDDEAVAVLAQLNAQGVAVALDDFRWVPGVQRLLEQARLVKIDVRAAEPGTLAQLLERLRGGPATLLALNVDSQEAFDHCHALGFNYFQGFFLCRPRALSAPGLPDSKLNTLRLMAALQSPEAEPDELEAIIRTDLTLHYRLLRTVNSAYYGLPVEVKSIGHAITCLGMVAVRRWAALQLLAAEDEKPPEVLRLALIRARMCEQLIAGPGKDEQDKAFTTGLFSLLDAVFDTPMDLILEKLPLDRDVAGALASGAGPYGRLLGTVTCYESGDWTPLEEDGLYALDTVTRCYLGALPWARAQFDALGG